MEDDLIIRPNAHKEFIKNIIFIAVSLLLIIGVGIFLQMQVGLDFITQIFETFEIPTQGMGPVVAAFAGSMVLLLLVLSHSNIKHLQYVLHADSIEYSQTQSLVFLSKQNIPFANITRVTFSNEGFLNKLLTCGEVKIELSGVETAQITLVSIDSPENLTAIIQQKVTQFNMQRQMQYQQRQKVSTILQRF